MVSICALALGLGALPGVAGAEASKGKATSEAAWSISFLGGVVIPQRNMTETHEQGLAAGGRLGWTGDSGFGVYLAADYAPLSRQDTADPLESFETHFGLLTLQPTFTLRWKRLRLWLGGGAGVAAERTLRTVPRQDDERRTDYAPVATGASGLELHLFSGGGLTLTGSYSKAFGKLGFVEDRTYKLVNVTGGLVFAFR